MRGNTVDFGPLENPELVFLGIIFGIICAFIAYIKNRNTTIWFFLGLLFSWVSILVLILLTKKN